MEVVPTRAVPAQTLDVILDSQATTIELRQLATGLYMNLILNGVEVVGLVICENLNRIVRNAYFGFSGDFVFLDNTGMNRDPFYTGLGTDFSLIYLSPDDLGVLA